jgi:transcriptional regulator GlxA family with amidase domain
MIVYVLVLDGVFDTGLSTFLDTLSVANELAVLNPDFATRFNIKLVGVRKNVKTSQGLTVPVQLATSLPRPDVILVPALAAKMPDTLSVELERPDIADAGEYLQKWSREKTLVSAACTGTFILASALLLDGQPATTTWWLSPFFRERFPNVLLDETRMLVQSANIVTAGAALAHLDLALWLVRRASPGLAALVARYLVVDPRPSQAGFIILDQLAHHDTVVEKFETWARQHLSKGFSLGQAAKAAGTSERTLTRRLHAVVGKSPLAYFQDLRVEKAVHLLQTTRSSVDQIAARVGYTEGVTLRTLLRRKIGKSVREIRERDNV